MKGNKETQVVEAESVRKETNTDEVEGEGKETGKDNRKVIMKDKKNNEVKKAENSCEKSKEKQGERETVIENSRAKGKKAV